jgi:hypothetical protein
VADSFKVRKEDSIDERNDKEYFKTNETTKTSLR